MTGRPRVVVLGDLLLDVDTVGTVERLCPDAPAPVVDVAEERARPGGAGLAAALAAGDGCEVVLVAPVAGDEAGSRAVRLLAPAVALVPVPAAGSTPVKHRVLAGSRGLVRMDTGSGAIPRGPLPAAAREALAAADAVLVSDYGRGATADPGLRAALADATRRVPIVWDPHPRGAAPVGGVRLATPNAAEAARAARPFGTDGGPSGTGLAAAGRHAAVLVAGWGAAAVAVTLGEQGALLSYGSGAPALLPARPVSCSDPCGAGDRFAARAAVRLAQGAVTLEAVESAVAAATDYVEAGGAAAVGPAAAPPQPAAALPRGADAVVAAVRARGGTVVATGGCFDLLHAGHVATLRAARRLGDCLVVCLNSDGSVRRLKGPGRPLVTAADRARVLEAMECVDAVAVFDEDTPVEILRRLRPHVWAKGGDYAGADLPEQAVLAGWGGQAVVLPYLDGRSTTGLVHAALDAAGRAATAP